MELHGRRVVVTGASSGIGRQLALDLVREGAKAVLVARRTELLKDVQGEIRSAGGDAEVYPCDVSDSEKYQETARFILEAGPVDVLINNAGYGFAGPFLRYSPAEVERLMRTNFMGAVLGVSAFAPGMKERGMGHIVNLASMAGLIPVPYLGAYSATKFALAALSQALRHELAPFGVGVSTICPGAVDTPFFEAHPSLSKPRGLRRARAITGARVSRGVLTAIRKNQGLVIFPRSLSFLAVVMRIVPGLQSLALAFYARRAARAYGGR
ncbi:MAG: SDR family NAD(P)-dependent oxidoreductase [Nitrospinota bacterium]